MPVSDGVVDAILSLVRSARPGHGNADLTDKACRLGPRPARRSGADALRPRPRALRRPPCPSLDDVHALAEPVLEHRMALTFAARAEGMSVRDVIAGLVKQARG